MEDLQIFQNAEFGSIRVINENGELWFIGKEIAEILGYGNTRKAIIDHVDKEDKGVTKRDTLGGSQQMTVINESGLYSLILSSKLPQAKRFKRWVTHEVLPCIRKTGSYGQQMQVQPPTINVQVFTSERFGKLRAADIDNKPHFVARDIAAALGYKSPSCTVSYYCKNPPKYEIPTKSGRQYVNFITEGDVCRLVKSSGFYSPAEFTNWLFNEVIPSIRKTGIYSLPTENKGESNNERAALFVRMAELATTPEERALYLQKASIMLEGGADNV